MTGSVALDVVIGLVFLYLLYSLFATVIMEIFNTFFGLRARNLRYALRRMLMDEKTLKWSSEGQDDSYWKTYWKRIGNLIIRMPYKMLNTILKIFGFASDLSNPNLFHAFYKQPSVKYLSAGGTANKPSYITPQNFSKTIIDVLKEHGTGDSHLDQSDDAQSLLEKISDGIAELPADSDTKKHLESLLADAQNDLEKFKFFLEQWFDDTMERAAGWFKRFIHFFLFVIGFCLAVSFNANTLDIIKKLADDPEARGQLVEMATSYTKDNQELIEEINKLRTKNTDVNDSVKVAMATKKVEANIDSIQKIATMLNEDIAEAQSVIDTNWKIPGEDQNTFWNKLKYALRLENIWGFLLTAFAISLGSPFWFDLLNKLITLRNSIQPKKGQVDRSSNELASTPKRVG